MHMHTCRCTHTRIHSHSDKCHPPGHGGYHHPLPIYGGSSHLRDAAAPALSAPLLLLTQCQCTPSRRGGDLWVTLHPEVGSLCAAPMLPAHRWVLAAPNAPQGGCTAWLGQKIKVSLLLKKKRESEEGIFCDPTHA